MEDTHEVEFPEAVRSVGVSTCLDRGLILQLLREFHDPLSAYVFLKRQSMNLLIAQARARLEEEQANCIKEGKKRAIGRFTIGALKAHHGTITMKAVKAMSKQQLIEEYENIYRRLERMFVECSVYLFWTHSTSITEPPSKRQRVERASSQLSNVPAASTQPADDHDSAGGSSFHPAGSAPPFIGSAAPHVCWWCYLVFLILLSLLQHSIDSAGSHRASGLSPFADSADSSSPTPVSTDHIPIDVLFEATSGGINEFFLDSDEDAQIGFKVETFPDSAAYPPHSESESDDDMENYIPPLPYGAFQDWEMMKWVVSSWKLYPKSSVHVLDLTNGKTVYMFVDKVYPIRATLLERMLRHRLTVPPSYCRDVVVAGNVIQEFQLAYENPMSVLHLFLLLYNFGVSACTARQMVFSSPWLTAKKESGSPLQTALVCISNPLMVARVWKSVRYDISKGLDTTYWSFLEHGYAVSSLMDTAYWSLECGQLNAAPVLEVEKFTNRKKRFMCHILGIEPQFENIIKNGPFIPMTAGQRKQVGQWTGDERKAANLDQRLKSLIMILPAESQRNTTDPSVSVTDSSAINYDSTDESSVCSNPLPPLKKLDGAEPISGPKTIKSILWLKSTFKAETLKGVIINEPSSAPAKGNKSSSASKVNSAPAGKLKSEN
ncbi:hypothetical protein Tco_0469518 [Tanacetum coccineum]